VALNQLLLGPVVVSAVFAWNLSWSGRLKELPNKWRRDTLPTLRKGWAFWVPASSINFACVRRCVVPCVPAHRPAHASLRSAAHRCICVSVRDLRRPPLRTTLLAAQAGAAAAPGAVHVRLRHRVDDDSVRRIRELSAQRGQRGGGRTRPA
jgi:hypothetical protein